MGFSSFVGWIDFLHDGECDGSVSVAMVDLFAEWSIPLVPVWDTEVGRVEASASIRWMSSTPVAELSVVR